MTRNEADIRAQLIDPSIHARGWTEDLIAREVTAGAIEIVGEKARRYYQDATIRAVLEKLARGEMRALLSLAMGAGKTFIAVNLLKRIAETI